MTVFRTTVYGNASMTVDDLNLLVCTYLICVVYDKADCQVSAMLTGSYNFPLILSYDNLSKYSLNDLINESTERGSENHLFSCRLNNAVISEHDAQNIEFGTLSVVVFGYILPFIEAFGILGYLAYFWTVYRVSVMRNVTNFYLVNLGVSDVLTLVTGYTLRQYQILHANNAFDTTNLSHVFDRVNFFVTQFIRYSSVFLGLGFCSLITVERYWAISRPLQYVQSKKRAAILVTLTWIISIAINVGFYAQNAFWFETFCFIYPNATRFTHLTGLTEVVTENTANVTALFATNIASHCVFWLILVANAVLYGLTVKHIRKQPQIALTVSQVRNRRRNHVTVMLLINGAVFFASFLPIAIGNTIHILKNPWFNPSTDKYSFRRSWNCFMAILRLLNSAINPVIFNAGSERYRAAFAEAVCCKKKQKRTDDIELRVRMTRNPNHAVPVHAEVAHCAP